MNAPRPDIELLREAAAGWPTPNTYTRSCDQIQASFDALLRRAERAETALESWRDRAFAALDKLREANDNTDHRETALAFIVAEAQAGLTEVAQGVPNAPTFWLEAIEKRARAALAAASTLAPQDREGQQVEERTVCDCDRLGRSFDDECIHERPCAAGLGNPRTSAYRRAPVAPPGASTPDPDAIYVAERFAPLHMWMRCAAEPDGIEWAAEHRDAVFASIDEALDALGFVRATPEGTPPR